MPATITGRGSQVILTGQVRRAARGAAGTSLVENTRIKTDLEFLGSISAGYSHDGRTSTGGSAHDVTVLAPEMELDAAVLTSSGGVVSAPTSFANVSYNMLASGAVGDGVTDDTAKIQTFLNTLPVGVEVVLPANHQFLIDSADIIVPPGLTFQGQGALEPNISSSAGNMLVGPAFILNPNYRIVLQGADRLSNLKILRKGLLATPTTAQSNTAVAAWAAEAPLRKTSAVTNSGNTLPFSNTSGITVGMRACGNELGAYNPTVTAIVPNTSITFSQVVGPYPIPAGSYVRFGNSVALHLAVNCGGISLDNVFIMGFNTAILSETGRWWIDAVEIDCTTAMYVTRGGDSGEADRIHCVPYYGGDPVKRPGPLFLLTRADGFTFRNCGGFGWANGWVLANVGGVTLYDCWCEVGGDDGVTVTTGIKTEIWIGNLITFTNCFASGSICFDFQHAGGSAVVHGGGTATNAVASATQIAHHRLGPNSTGILDAPYLLASGSAGPKPVIVQPGVGPWTIVAPAAYNLPNPWITGAAADVANITLIGTPALNAAAGSLAFKTTANGLLSFGNPMRLTGPDTNASMLIANGNVGLGSIGLLDGAGAGVGMFSNASGQLKFGPIDANGVATGTWMNVTATGTYPGALHLGQVNSDPSAVTGGIEMYPGYGGFGVTAGTLNYNFTGSHQFLNGSTPILQMSASIGLVMQTPMQTLTVGFNGTAPIAKRTGWGAATGTATRSTFLTSSVTLPQLAEHVKALMDDLIAYGLIGP